MGWTNQRTWVTGEQLTSGQLNTYIRDDLRYLHGDDGPIDLLAELRVPALVVGGRAVGAQPVLAGGYSSGLLPSTSGGVRVLSQDIQVAADRAWRVHGRAWFEVPDSGDAGHRVELILDYFGNSVSTFIDTARASVPAWTHPTPWRVELTVEALLSPGETGFQQLVRLYGRKTGGSSLSTGGGIFLIADPR